MPAGLRNRVALIYIESARRMVQTEPYAVKYHPKLAYTLRPGTWKFSNVEFSNTFHINAAGLRDDEESLLAPEIIVAGDSYAMGWGVEQEETYAQLLEKRTGRRVLNMGVSSYGTAREMLALNMVDTSRLKYLIIQYSLNDYEENKIFFMSRNRLEINTEAEQAQAIANSIQQRRYWPGKYTILVLRSLKDAARHALRPGTKPVPEPRQDAGYLFLNAILHAAPPGLENVRLIAFGIHPPGMDRENQDFISSLAATVPVNNFTPAIKSMKVLDLSDRLEKPGQYYLLDEHLTAEGHKSVAEAVFQAMDA